jgi:type II secretory pathway predicted ATPase ExeA
MDYKNFYRMQAEAFGSLPVLNLFFNARTHQDGWRYLTGSLAAAEPFVLVTGDYGMGKTLLSMMLVRLLNKKGAPMVQITDPHTGCAGILRQSAAALGVETHHTDEESLLAGIYERLEALPPAQRFAVIIDDAQELGVEALVRLRAFANFNRNGMFPVQLIFFAHPSFGDLLKDPRLTAVDQRIRRRHRLAPLTLQETREYIYFRLFKSGAPGAPFFDEDAFQTLHGMTGGVPRRINTLCDAALMLGASLQETCISAATIREAGAASGAFDVAPVLPRSEVHFSTPLVHLAGAPQDPARVPVQAAAPARHRRTLLAAAAACAVLMGAAALLRTYITEPPARFVSADIPRAEMPAEASQRSASSARVQDMQPSGFEPPVSVAAESEALIAFTDSGIAVAGSESGIEVEQSAVVPAAGEAIEADAEHFSVTAVPALTDEALEPSVEQGFLQDVAAEAMVADAEPLRVAGMPALMEEALEPPVEQGFAQSIAADTDFVRPYTLRLGCFNTAASVNSAAAVYAQHTISPVIAQVSLGEVRWWIFYAGSFVSRAEARGFRARSELPEADILPMPYACRLGIFESDDHARTLLFAMHSRGYEPYMIDNNDGSRSLLVGVYRQRSNAEALQQQLAESGIESAVVLLCPEASALVEMRARADKQGGGL